MTLIIGLIGFDVGFAQVPAAVEPKSEASQSAKTPELLALALKALKAGDDAKADEAFRELVEWARQAFEVHDVETAKAILRQIVNLSDYPEAHFTLAEIYRQTGWPMWALRHYEEYLKQNPADPAAHFGKGVCHLAKDQFALAVHHLKNLIELDPNHVLGLSNLALAVRGRSMTKNRDLDLYTEALDYMRQAVTAAADDEKEREQLGDHRLRLATFTFEYQTFLLAANRPDEVDFDESLDLFGQAAVDVDKELRKDPVSLALLNLLGQCYDGITSVYRVKAEREPNDPEPYLRLAALADRRKLLDARKWDVLALEYLQKARDASPQDAYIHALYAQGCTRLGLSSHALEAIEQAIKLDPDNKDYQEFKVRLALATQPVPKKAEGKKP